MPEYCREHDYEKVSGGVRVMAAQSNLAWRHKKAAFFKNFCIGVTGFAVLILCLLIYQVSVLGLPWLDAQFLSSFPSRFPEKAGIKSALMGTLWLVSMTAAIAIPIGVLAAVYLEEYAKPTRLTEFININIANLAGVPSILSNWKNRTKMASPRIP